MDLAYITTTLLWVDQEMKSSLENMGLFDDDQKTYYHSDEYIMLYDDDC